MNLSTDIDQLLAVHHVDARSRRRIVRLRSEARRAAIRSDRPQRP